MPVRKRKEWMSSCQRGKRGYESKLSLIENTFGSGSVKRVAKMDFIFYFRIIILIKAWATPLPSHFSLFLLFFFVDLAVPDDRVYNRP
jgi:hypothetical protein